MSLLQLRTKAATLNGLTAVGITTNLPRALLSHALRIGDNPIAPTPRFSAIAEGHLQSCTGRL